MTNKIMASVKVPANIHQRIMLQVIADGYGMRGKSRWVEEAITAFLEIPNHIELVDIATEMHELAEALTVRLEENTVTALENAIIAIRKVYPTMEGVKSNIIRASIMQRLLRQ